MTGNIFYKNGMIGSFDSCVEVFVEFFSSHLNIMNFEVSQQRSKTAEFSRIDPWDVDPFISTSINRELWANSPISSQSPL